MNHYWFNINCRLCSAKGMEKHYTDLNTIKACKKSQLCPSCEINRQNNECEYCGINPAWTKKNKSICVNCFVIDKTS